MQRYALIGHPVEHSLSPALHNHWFSQYGIEARYDALPLDPSRAGEVAQVFRAEGLDGANLTVPFKEHILDALDEIGPTARVARSVNTLWWEGGRLCGDSTDAAGFVDALEVDRPLDLSGVAVVLGTGGAGRAVAVGLAQRGFTRVALLNRTTRRADEAAAQLAAHFPHTEFTVGSLRALSEYVEDATVVASCVSGPGREAVRALDVCKLPADSRWCDLNYWDRDPPHRATLGPRFDDGRRMLIAQAARAFEHWTGHRPTLDTDVYLPH